MPVTSTPTFAEYSEQFLTAMRAAERSPGTIKNYESILRVWLLPEFGTMRLGTITETKVWDFTDRLATATGKVNRSHIYHTLQSMMKLAARRWKYIPEWTLQIEKVGGEHSLERPSFTLEQAHKVIDFMPPHMRNPCRVAIGAALRLGEVCGLNIGHWDREERALTVVQQSRNGELREPKVGSKGVVYPILDAPEILDSWTAIRPGWGRDTDAMFRGERGARLHPTQLRSEWAKARKLVRLDDMHFHDLRSVGLTIYARIPGATLKDVMDHGRHKDIKSAMKYQRGSDADRRRRLSQGGVDPAQ